MEFNCAAAPERFVAVARALGEQVEVARVLDGARRAAPAVRRLADTIGIPRSLADYGLSEHDVPDVVEEAMKSGNVAVNPRRTSRQELTEILRQAL